MTGWTWIAFFRVHQSRYSSILFLPSFVLLVLLVWKLSFVHIPVNYSQRHEFFFINMLHYHIRKKYGANFWLADNSMLSTLWRCSRAGSNWSCKQLSIHFFILIDLLWLLNLLACLILICILKVLEDQNLIQHVKPCFSATPVPIFSKIPSEQVCLELDRANMTETGCDPPLDSREVYICSPDNCSDSFGATRLRNKSDVFEGIEGEVPQLQSRKFKGDRISCWVNTSMSISNLRKS